MASFVYDSCDSRAGFGQNFHGTRSLVDPTQCKVGVLEWPNTAHTCPHNKPQPVALPVSQFVTRDHARLRIVLAPLDRPNATTIRALQAIFSHYDIPSEFVQEQQGKVTHSFMSYPVDESTEVCWFHALSKNIELRQAGKDAQSIQDPRGTNLSQYDGTWARSAYFLKWRKPCDAGEGSVELVVFSPSRSLRSNLENLLARTEWEQAIIDPFCLLVVVLDHLFRQLDGAIWAVNSVFGPVEHGVLASAEQGKEEPQFDFIGIHNLAKHVIYLRESSHAAWSTANHICERHHSLLEQRETSQQLHLTQSIHTLLQHKLGLFEVCKFRVETLDSRLKNTINLAFNTVSQRDSHILKADSQSMRVIAMMTMFFLPAATVGSICGSGFFSNNAKSNKLEISTDFKYLWVVAIPLTVMVFLVYGLWRWLRRRGLLLGEKIRGLRSLSCSKV